jgi:dipeptidyl-peptidase 4
MPSSSLPRQLARTRRFRPGAPDRFTIAADGGTVLFLRSRAGDDPVTCLWALDVRDSQERLLADPDGLTGGAAERLPQAERTRRERAGDEGSGIVSYAADEAAGLVVFGLSDDLWTVQIASGPLVTRVDTAAVERWYISDPAEPA